MNIFNMGGYGLYVWPAYLITFSVLILNLYWAYKENKTVKKKLRQSSSSSIKKYESQTKN